MCSTLKSSHEQRFVIVYLKWVFGLGVYLTAKVMEKAKKLSSCETKYKSIEYGHITDEYIKKNLNNYSIFGNLLNLKAKSL